VLRPALGEQASAMQGTRATNHELRIEKLSVFSVASVANNIGLSFSVAEEFNSVNLCESVSKKTLDSLCSLCAPSTLLRACPEPVEGTASVAIFLY